MVSVALEVATVAPCPSSRVKETEGELGLVVVSGVLPGVSTVVP